MRIGQIESNFRPIEEIQKQKESAPIKGAKKGDFASMLADAVREANNLQLEADQKIEAMVLGKGNVQPHDAMIALEKADVAFQLMNAVRGKIIQAYEQIIRTQI
jgi:flagellar hook-basal body complex protein FliE